MIPPVYEAHHLDYYRLWVNDSGGIQVFPRGTGNYKILYFNIDKEGTCHNMDTAEYHKPEDLLKLIHKNGLKPSFSHFKLVEVKDDETESFFE